MKRRSTSNAGVLAIAALAIACGNRSGTVVEAAGGASSSTAVGIPSASAPGLSGTPSTTSTPPLPPNCDAGNQAFIRRAMLAVLGRRPVSQSEVDVYSDVVEQRAASGASTGELQAARRDAVRALMLDAAFALRWSDFFKDALRVARTQTKSAATCYGTSDGAISDGGALAAYVRDHDPNDANPPQAAFRMRQLLASALDLDDLSVVYRANLFAMLGRPFMGNSSALELELARRNDFGTIFETTYTRRDLTCLGCHNGEFSVTASSDPLTNRFWPVPGLYERALLGSSFGTFQASNSAPQTSAVLRARGMFRYDGVGNAAGRSPFGWDGNACGAFLIPTVDDPLGIDTYFGSIHATQENPNLGRQASVWDLERSLHRGVDALAERGPTRTDDGAVNDPDQAFAYLVGLSIVEQVWTETVGTPLTVSHHFPRTEAQRDVLHFLTESFVRNRFSLKKLLIEIVNHETFNLAAPDAGCGNGPYSLPRLFDPWTDKETDSARQGNGPGDAVFPISPRVLRRSLHASLGWPNYEEYPTPSSTEETLALSLGFYLRDAEPGHRELDFQGRLAWEASYGRCLKLGDSDFISHLVERAANTPEATLRDAVVALKDRLLGVGSTDAHEQAPLESLLEAPLDGRDFSNLDSQLRRLCGVWIASPWFMLGGIVPNDARGAPRLVAVDADYAAICETAQARLRLLGASDELLCAE